MLHYMMATLLVLGPGPSMEKTVEHELTQILETEEGDLRRVPQLTKGAMAVIDRVKLATSEEQAALSLANTKDKRLILAAAEARHLLAGNTTIDHLGSPTLACILYGSNPHAYRRIRTQGWVPADRAPGCAAEYESVKLSLAPAG
ncbi:DUF4344 domain-containing metallopeptidase [Nonomuraea sp. NPDC050556]|uniref:DUF4344 domain-containing metallopeptidase n=1 Tax=Nonomuraea sp. NPDC050556 TaxID=3364369 RepID=UPI0037998292